MVSLSQRVDFPSCAPVFTPSRVRRTRGVLELRRFGSKLSDNSAHAWNFNNGCCVKRDSGCNNGLSLGSCHLWLFPLDTSWNAQMCSLLN